MLRATDRRKRTCTRLVHRVVYGVKLNTRMVNEEVKCHNRINKQHKLDIPDYLNFAIAEFLKERAPHHEHLVYPAFFGSIAKEQKQRDWFLSLVPPTLYQTRQAYIEYDKSWFDVESPIDKLILQYMANRFNEKTEKDVLLQLYIGYVYL